MALEITMAPRRMFFLPISWAAIFAALAVGIAAQLLLILAGLAVGVSVVQPIDGPLRNISLAATGWSVASMVITAFIGGYVAARASGLRRRGDGMLHGAVAWAAMTLIYAVLATTVLSAAGAGVFGALRPLMSGTSASEHAKMRDAEQRMADTQRSLEDAGLSVEQATALTVQMAEISADAAISNSAAARAQIVADELSFATGWLSTAVLLSLIAGVLGGLAGTAGMPRVSRRTDIPLGEARILSRSIL